MVARPIKIAKEVNVLHVEPKAVQKYWSLVEFMLKEGLKYDGYPMSIGHLKDTILKGENQLFMMFGSDDGESYKVFGVFVTRVTQLPNYKQAEVILLRGVKRDLWQKEAAEMIENFAIQHDCKKIAVHARPGWQPFLKTMGWQVKRYLYTKEFK